MKQSKLLLILLAMFVIMSCDELIVDDISENEIVLLAPENGLTTEIATQNFWWEEMDEVETYRLQIVSPGFENASVLHLDTALTQSKFEYTLTAGEYEWRVRGENSNSYTTYTIRSITIEETPDLTNQKVALSSPVDKFAQSASGVSFEWLAVPFTSNYYLTIKETDWDGREIVTLPVTTTNAQYELNEGVYMWGVQAINAVSNTEYVTRILYIDQTAPDAPSITFPTNNEEILVNELPKAFTWERAEDMTGLSDSMLIATDDAFTNIVVARKLQDDSFQFNEAAGDYYLKVKSIDAAGNQGSYSATISFSVKNEK